MGFNFQILGWKELMAKLEKLPQGLAESTRKSVAKATSLVQVSIVRKVSGERLKRRTGRLASSIQILAPVIVGTQEIKGVIKIGGDTPRGPAVSYARIQEEGGTVKAKNSKYLTIPLDAVKTGAGDVRFNAREVISSPQSYGYDGTFFRNNILFGKQSNKVVPLFLLKTSVNIRPKWFVRDSVNENREKVVDLFNKSIKEEMKKIGVVL